MPIYEYRCEDCGKKSQFLTLSVGAVLDLKCPKCGGTRLRKLVSRVAILKSGESRPDDLADMSSMGEDLGDDDEGPASRAVEDSDDDPAGDDSAGEEE